MTRSDYVDHPRFGRSPRFSGVVPREPGLGYRSCRYGAEGIPGTAVEADLERQSYSPVPVLYYFDTERRCESCSRLFLFFAEEQKHWYETLGFSLDAECMRCVECRKKQQGIERCRRRYEALFHTERTTAEDLEMAECSLDLIEAGLFDRRHTERVRMLIRSVESSGATGSEEVLRAVRDRVAAIDGMSESP